MKRRSFAFVSLLIVALFSAHARAEEDPAFTEWLKIFKQDAAAQGVSSKVLESAFVGIEPDETVVTLDRKQPENKITLQKYLKNTISQRRITKGREMLVEYRDDLKRISQQYGVQPKYIVALWAIESDFSSQQGDFSVVRSLATLAYEGRRAAFFSKELVSALNIIESENIAPEDLTGSWAGAMGGCQFMPSTYKSFAADGDGDGRRDIWGNPIDIFASVANYLHSLGWDDKQEWGRAAVFPEGMHTDIKHGQTLKHWHKLGVKYTNGSSPSGSAIRYAIYAGSDGDGAYLVSENFKALLNWNRSRYFATAVGTLADAIGE